MKNVSKWLLMLVFAMTASITFTACNKVKVEDKCEKSCCADKAEKCDKGCEKACCSASEHDTACEPGCEKACCKDKQAATNGDSTSGEMAHVCDANCKTNGCSHAH